MPADHPALHAARAEPRLYRGDAGQTPRGARGRAAALAIAVRRFESCSAGRGSRTGSGTPSGPAEKGARARVSWGWPEAGGSPSYPSCSDSRPCIASRKRPWWEEAPTTGAGRKPLPFAAWPDGARSRLDERAGDRNGEWTEHGTDIANRRGGGRAGGRPGRGQPPPGGFRRRDPPGDGGEPAAVPAPAALEGLLAGRCDRDRGAAPPRGVLRRALHRAADRRPGLLHRPRGAPGRARDRPHPRLRPPPPRDGKPVRRLDGCRGPTSKACSTFAPSRTRIGSAPRWSTPSG